MLRCCSGAESSSGPGSTIKDGDHVIIYERFDSMQAVRVDANKTYGCRFGNFKMQTWVGKPFGSKAVSKEGRGWIFLLAPTPELWTQVLLHRTQILYVADISLITALLELRPGFKVLESGTGSGSLTHALARAVAPEGHVHTFEFHQQRAEEAAKEFAAHDLAGVITTEQRDIEKLGFPEALHDKADAVFLDLPGPWKVVTSAAKCLRSDGVFCAFSPCIEQVQRTCGALSQAGFYRIRTMECLLRLYEVKSQVLVNDISATPASRKAAGQKRKRTEDDQTAKADPGVLYSVTANPVQEARGHTGYLTFARRIVDEAEELPEAPVDLIEPLEGEQQD